MSDASGIYPITLTVRNQYSGGTYDATISDTMIVVNRNASVYGAGWSLAGIEELRLNQPGNKILWIGGDGSAKAYRNVGTNVWQAAAGTFRDTLRYDATAQTYTRTLRHRVQVVFDAQGRHFQTVNRAGQTTQFYWNPTSGRLDSIAVPPAVTSRPVYKFTYDGNGKLDRITDPANRVLDATVVNGQLTALIDPDTYTTGFGYDALGRLTGRASRSGFTTSFTYANGLRVTQAKVPLDVTTNDTATTVFQPWDEKGLNGQAAVDVAVIYTKIDGPRTDVLDTAEFWVDRWGAPTKIVNPIGATTQIVRGDAAVPALVTQVTHPDGDVVTMTWNARGNLTQLQDAASGLPTAVTNWAYNSPNTLDSPSSVTDPVNVITQFTYDTLGLLQDATAPNSHVSSFHVIPSGTLKGLVDAVIEHQVSYWDSASHHSILADLTTSFAFNTLGNDTLVTSPMGHVRRHSRDALQRVINDYDPAGHRTELVYDQINRIQQVLQHVEGIDSGYTTPLTSTYNWGAEALSSVVDPRSVPRSYGYDAALRPKTETDDYGYAETRFFNRAGLVDSVHPRAYTPGDPQTVRHTYDAAARELKVAWPAHDASSTDSVLYTYDAMGRILTGLSVGRKITRTYFPGGALKTELQSNADGSWPNNNTYGYDAARRRAWYVVGTVGNQSQSDSITYVYDAVTGDLRWVKVRWRKTDATVQYDSVQLWWDALGRRDSVIYSNGAKARFFYDADAQLRIACASGLDVFNFTQYHKWVDPDGLIRQTEASSGNDNLAALGCSGVQPTLQANTYDSRHQLVKQVLLSAGDSSFYWYDGSGNRVKWRHYVPPRKTVTYYMDALHNRVRILQDSLDPARDSIKFSYDLNGARTVEQPYHGQAFSGWGWRQYHSDGRGRPTGTDEYGCNTWDINGNCIGFAPIYHPTVCTYDPVGRTPHPCESSAPLLGLDGENVVRTNNDAASLAWTFVHGPGVDDPLMGRYSTLDGVVAYWVTDGAGRQLVVGDRTYGKDCTISSSVPCGNEYVNQGGKYAGGTTNARSFDATRHSSNDIYKVSFFRNRWYDQQTGRWTQEDPIGVAGGTNMYAYVGSNPVAYTDPFGLCPPPPGTFDPLCVAVNLSAGFGDAVTFGLTAKLRGDADAQVDKSSAVYTAGQVAGVAASTVLGGAVAKTIEEGGVLATSGPARAAGRLVVRAGESLFGRGGTLNTGGAFRIGVGKLGGGTGRAVLRVAGSVVKAATGVEHVNLVDLGRLVEWF